MVTSPGRNPARRSRKIGTSAQGHKNRNDFAIPTSLATAKRFYETLRNPVELIIELMGHQYAFLVEPVRSSFRYYVSVPDVLEVLKLIPQVDREQIDVIVLRQPKRKERIFSEVWGRMAYWADYGKHFGTSVVIEAQPLDFGYKLATSVGPVFAKELEALRSDGHRVEITKRDIEITCPPEAIRHTQLFRTLPHEIGHNVDYMTKVDHASNASDGDYDMLRELYFARPQREREAFADRYAATVMAPYRDNSIVPFPPLANHADSGLDPGWFYFDKVE